MRIHLTKNKKSLFSLEGLKKLDVPFRARTADTLEMVLLADDFSIDLRTVLNLLDYIDYERFINGERDSEYFKYLERAEKELFAYFSFLASDDLLDEYYKNREGNERDYKYSSIRFNKDSLKLMSYFIDTDVKECKNKFLEFRTLEDRLKCGDTDSSRKDNMLVAFTYRVYPSNDFYDCFSDLDLSMEDFVRRHQDLVKYNEECLLGEKYVIMVDGVAHEVTRDEKLAAFSFIEEHDLPKETKLYGLVIRGALSGDLCFEKKDGSRPKIYVKKSN